MTVVRRVNGIPWYSPRRPTGPASCWTVTATLLMSPPSSSGKPSSASPTIASNLSGSTSIT